MKIYSDTDRINEIRNPVITVGTFDGLHMGHQKILNRVNASAKELDGESVVLTFEPHPRKVLYPDDNDLRLINTQSEKIELMKSFEIEYLIIYPFTIEFSRMTSVEFVKEILVRRIGLKKLIIGYDHHFGRNREGGLDELKEFSLLYDFEMEEVEAMVVNNVKVSSTKIRKLLEDGKVYIANDFLGYQYTIVGKVIDGDKIGSKIDFPT
ncbi:MAG: adenylyltransferase/cytidyltransferase family protein, partial [Bacteroidetes bacterium]|nr:adenylyltransferase/cytidyltransferase family protein [Bacteroidota bacterium]